MGFFDFAEEKAPDVVLVPPLFERDHRGRSRMAKSSYDYHFCKPQLKWLFGDYLLPCASSLLRFSPPEDRRLTVKARFGASLESIGANPTGAISLRFQPEPDEYLTFIDLKAAAKAGSAQLRACYFDTGSGLGVFGRLPLTGDTLAGPQAETGVRFSSSELSAGFICQPLSERLTHLWLVHQQGALTAGWQLQPRNALRGFMQNARTSFAQQLQAAHANSSYSLAYSPRPAATSAGAFTAAVELREQRSLVVSFLYHMAVQRLCHNPLEDKSVVGIANYLDIGLQVVTQLAGASKPGDLGSAPERTSTSSSTPDLCFAIAFQANKNLLLKARASAQGISAAAALKAWWQPSFTLAASAAFDWATRQPHLGLALNVENYGNIRYERSHERQRMGKALMQRHVAISEEIANQQGKGLLVDKDHIDDPKTLGQVRRQSDKYL